MTAHKVRYAIKSMELVKPTKTYDKAQLTLKSCTIELYEETESYDIQKVLSSIKEYCIDKGAQYAIMKHDNDYFSEDTFSDSHQLLGRKGQKKANHYHVVIWFKNRVFLNDICIAFGIEDRWVKILKHDKDFDAFLLYCTHVKYDPAIKAHYEPSAYDTNIGEYIQFLYDSYISTLDDSNIITNAIELLNANKQLKISYQLYITSLIQLGHNLTEIKQFYNMLRDLLVEHNMNVEIADVQEHALSASRAESASRIALKLDEVDITGFATIQNGENTYMINKIERKKKN